MDLDLEQDVLGILFLMWAIVMAMIWKFMPNKESVPILTRVIISIVSVPVIDGVILWQKNKR